MLETVLFLIKMDNDYERKNGLSFCNSKYARIFENTKTGDKKHPFVDDLELCYADASPTSLEDLEVYVDPILLDFAIPNLSKNITTYVHALDLSTAIVNPVLISKIALFGAMTSDEFILTRIKEFVKSKRDTAARMALPFYLTAECFVNHLLSEPDHVRLSGELIDYLMFEVKGDKMDDDLFCLFSIAYNHGYISKYLDSSQGEVMIRHVESSIQSRLADLIISKTSLSRDSKLTNLILTRVMLDSKPRNSHLSWLPEYNTECFHEFLKIINTSSSHLLTLAPYMVKSVTLFDRLENNKDLMLTYWSGAALILLEASVMMKLKEIDESVYKAMIREKKKFYERVRKLEEISSYRVSGVLTDVFYKLRNKVVHGETGLTMHDLEEIVGFVSRFMDRIR